MEIISISLDEETRSRLDEIQQALGFKSRSKMLRSTIDLLLSEYNVIEKLTSKHEVVFVMTYAENERNHVAKMLHAFKEQIKVTVHQHHGKLGLDMLNVEADAKDIKKLLGTLKNSKCIRSLNFVLLGRRN